MRKSAYTLLYCALALFALVSCEHKELCYHHDHRITVRVAFDWVDAPAADPAGMCVFFYPETGGAPFRFDFPGLVGGEVLLPAGKYRALCYNNDTEGILFRNMNRFETHEGYTRNDEAMESIFGRMMRNIPRNEATATERVTITPDMMWGCTATDIEIDAAGVTSVCVPETEKENIEFAPDREFLITLYPHELICTYTYEVRNVPYLKHVTEVFGSLSSMSGGIFFGDESLHTECVTLPFDGTATGDSTITGRFYTFGHHEDNTQHHRMMLYVQMDNGKTYVFGSDNAEKFDVTDQVHNAPDRRRVHIIIDGINLPQPIENGGGYRPSVDDWEVVQKDIIF